MAIVNSVIKNYQLTVGCFMLSYLGWVWILLILLKTENWKLKTIKKITVHQRVIHIPWKVQ